MWGADPHSVQKAVNVLQNGGIVVFPTDTAYGLGCDFENENAIQRILAVKGRTDTRFTVIAGSREQVLHFFTLNETARQLAQQYWPGPLSIVVNDHAAVRVPDNDIAIALVNAYGRPLIATSANISKRPPHYTLAGAQRELGKQNVDLWIDGGDLPERPASTIVDTQGDTVKVIRHGAITLPQ